MLRTLWRRRVRPRIEAARRPPWPGPPGLLTPRPSYSAVTGPSIAQPVYFVLGESWDTTLEASYLSDRGFGSALELRWAPTVDSSGELRGSLILDFGKIVFALVDNGHMRKTDEDQLDDFRDVYEFKSAFESDYRIEMKA